jgi:hypothetical protein
MTNKLVAIINSLKYQKLRKVSFRPLPHTHTHTHTHTHIHTNKDQILIYPATPPNEPRQCILTHFNNCNFSKSQTVCSLRMVFLTPKHFNVNFYANLKLFLRLSNCASVGEKTLISVSSYWIYCNCSLAT